MMTVDGIYDLLDGAFDITDCTGEMDVSRGMHWIPPEKIDNVLPVLIARAE